LCKIYDIPKNVSSYNFLQAIHWIINKHIHHKKFTNTLVFTKELFKNKSSIINEYKFYNRNIISKHSCTFKKNHENIHETYVALHCTNILIQNIPNFYYVFGFYEDNNNINIIGEKIIGQTLLEYINSSQFNFKEFLFILLQLSLALQVAQNQYCFVHNDLTPWNIILKKIPKTTFEYKLSYNKIIKITTSLIPIIIDYGKSHITHNNIHYGYVNMYKSSSCQDILTILITSIHQILSSKLNVSHKDILLLSSFFSNTKYCKNTFKHINNLKKFVYIAHKYTEITFSNKYELENIKPYDFFLFITSNFSYNFNYEITNTYTYISPSNTRQIFDYITADNINKKIKSYTNVYTRIKNFFEKNINLFDTLDKTLSYYYIQSFENQISSTHKQLTSFLNENNINNNSYTQEYKYLSEHLQILYNKLTLQKNIKIQYEYPTQLSLIKTPYTLELFMSPNKIYDLNLNSDIYNIYDIYFYVNVLESILLNQSKFSVTEEDKSFYTTTYSDILNLDTFFLNNNNALKKTFQKICYNMYNENINQLNSSKDIIDIQNILNLYSKILKKHINI
jgi:hypothetical protein